MLHRIGALEEDSIVVYFEDSLVHVTALDKTMTMIPDDAAKLSEFLRVAAECAANHGLPNFENFNHEEE